MRNRPRIDDGNRLRLAATEDRMIQKRRRSKRDQVGLMPPPRRRLRLDDMDGLWRRSRGGRGEYQSLRSQRQDASQVPLAGSLRRVDYPRRAWRSRSRRRREDQALRPSLDYIGWSWPSRRRPRLLDRDGRRESNRKLGVIQKRRRSRRRDQIDATLRLRQPRPDNRDGLRRTRRELGMVEQRRRSENRDVGIPSSMPRRSRSRSDDMRRL